MPKGIGNLEKMPPAKKMMMMPQTKSTQWFLDY